MSDSRIKILALFLGLVVCAIVASFWFLTPNTDASADKKKKVVESSDAPKAIGPYSQAIIADDFMFLSGQVARDPKTGKMIEGGTAEQAEQVMKNLETILRASGSSFDDVVKTTIFLSDMNDFATVNGIYGKYFKGAYPARSTVQVARLPLDAKIEIEMTALVKK
jgi:2-iminobutanoate/2-iminopropanoate deaminase